MDISPCTSTHAVIQYVAKYASKDEPTTENFTELANRVAPYLNDNSPMLSLACKLINRLIGERDWSAQEVSHICFGVPLTGSTRIVVNLDGRPEDQHATMLEFDEDGVETGRGKSLLRKYCDRGREWEQATLFQFLTKFEHTGGSRKWRPRTTAKDRVISYLPR